MSLALAAPSPLSQPEEAEGGHRQEPGEGWQAPRQHLPLFSLGSEAPPNPPRRQQTVLRSVEPGGRSAPAAG